MRIITLTSFLITGAAMLGAAQAQDVVAMATIRVGELVSESAIAPAPLPNDPTASAQEMTDRAEDARMRLAMITGKEAARTIYAGRVVTDADLRAPTLIERNTLVKMVYSFRGLTIEAEGRAMERGSAGDLIRVMNLNSRQTVTGTVSGPNIIEVRG